MKLFRAYEIRELMTEQLINGDQARTSAPKKTEEIHKFY